MTKETQTQAIAEPFKFKNAALLNRLSEMAQVPYYATACHTLIQAEMAIVELERENATLRAEVERLAAQSAPTEAPQEFESAQGRALASAWAEGWTQCRDAEYAGEEAQSEAFNQSYTLAQCLHADQTRLQGGLSNDQLRRAWGAKLPRVIPTDEQLTAFALGIEVAVAQSAPLAQQADCTCEAKDMPFGRCCRAAAQVEPPSMPSSEWLAEAERLASVCRTHIATLEDHRALNAHLSKRVTAQVEPVRMLTQPELNDVALSEKVGWGPGEYVEAVQRAFCRINAGRAIPPDGKIGCV